MCVSSSLGWVSLKGERIWFVMDEHRDGLSYQDLQDDIVYGGALGEGAYGEMLDLLFETVCVLASATDVFHDEVADEQRLCAPDLNPFDDCRYDVLLAPEEFSHIQSGDNRQSRSADSGQCAGSRLPNLCSGYTPLGCIPLTFVACGTASTE